jgi:hypothetical protein
MSLFVCPICGFQDAPIWRTSRFAMYQLQSTFSEVESFFPVLAESLLESADGWVFEKPYWYKLTRNRRRVYRMTEIGKSEFQSHGFTEKPKDPFQKKLEVSC